MLPRWLTTIPLLLQCLCSLLLCNRVGVSVAAHGRYGETQCPSLFPPPLLSSSILFPFFLSHCILITLRWKDCGSRLSHLDISAHCGYTGFFSLEKDISYARRSWRQSIGNFHQGFGFSGQLLLRLLGLLEINSAPSKLLGNWLWRKEIFEIAPNLKPSNNAVLRSSSVFNIEGYNFTTFNYHIWGAIYYISIDEENSSSCCCTY